MVSTRTVQLGPGLQFHEEYAEDCIAGAAFSKGDVVVFDIALGAATDNDPGEDDSGLVNVVAVATADLDFGLFGVVMEDVASGGRCRVLIKGRVKVQIPNLQAVQTGLIGVNASQALGAATGAGTDKIVAIALETGATSTLTWVLFDGINGFGTDAA